MQVLDPGASYLELVLRLRRLAPELVSDYFGPEEIAARVDAEPAPTAKQICDAATALLKQIQASELESARRRWLSAHVLAIRTVGEWLCGESLGYRELAERCYGVTPVPVSEETFQRAHGTLDDALPGSGDLPSRYRRWMDSQTVPDERLDDGLAALSGELSARAREKFDLPPGEKAVFELVSAEPWLGFAAPLGNGHTLIRLNRDLPIAAFRLLEVVSHEGYPGHHCEAACKGAALVIAKGWTELLSWGYCLPQAMISEGIAELALEALLGAEADEVGAAILQPLGIPYDPAVAAAVREAWEMLRPVRTNLAMMLDERTVSRQDARDYLRTWRLEDDEFIDRSLASLLARNWKPYESCYTDGLALCRRYVNGDPGRFQRLLAEPLIPVDLVGAGPATP